MVKLIPILGDDCQGKTTFAYQLSGRLKEDGVQAEVLSDTSRSLPFPRKDIGSVESQYYLAGKQLEREALVKIMRKDLDVMLLDKCFPDFLAYSMIDYPERFESLKLFLERYILDNYWCVIQVENPDIKYRGDGLRPKKYQYKDTWKSKTNDLFISKASLWSQDPSFYLTLGRLLKCHK